MLKRIFLGLLLAILLLVAAVAVKTWTTPSQQLAVAPAPKLDIDLQAAAKRLSTAITFRTVSGLDDPAANAAEFDKLHAYLAQQYPKVHATLKKEVVGNKALLYTWTGTDPSAKPVALMAHQDMLDPVLLEQRVIDREHRAARIAEDVLHALIGERLDHHFGAGHFFRHRPLQLVAVRRISGIKKGPKSPCSRTADRGWLQPSEAMRLLTDTNLRVIILRTLCLFRHFLARLYTGLTWPGQAEIASAATRMASAGPRAAQPGI